jgi:hypothetical protein
MSTPTQQGTALLQVDVPTFTNFVIAADTWRPRNTTEVKPFRGGAKGRTVNVTFADPGVEVSCEWAVVANATPAKIGDVVTDGATTKWLVTACEDMGFGEGPRMQAVTLTTKLGLTLT